MQAIHVHVFSCFCLLLQLNSGLAIGSNRIAPIREHTLSTARIAETHSNLFHDEESPQSIGARHSKKSRNKLLRSEKSTNLQLKERRHALETTRLSTEGNQNVSAASRKRSKALRSCHPKVVRRTCRRINSYRPWSKKISRRQVQAMLTIHPRKVNSLWIKLGLIPKKATPQELASGKYAVTCSKLCRLVKEYIERKTDERLETSDVGCYKLPGQPPQYVDVTPQKLAETAAASEEFAPDAGPMIVNPADSATRGAALVQHRIISSDTGVRSKLKPDSDIRTALLGGRKKTYTAYTMWEIFVRIAGIFRIFPCERLDPARLINSQSMSLVQGQGASLNDWAHKIAKTTVLAKAWISEVIAELLNQNTLTFRQKWFGGNPASLSEDEVRDKIDSTVNFVERELDDGILYVYPADDSDYSATTYKPFMTKSMNGQVVDKDFNLYQVADGIDGCVLQNNCIFGTQPTSGTGCPPAGTPTTTIAYVFRIEGQCTERDGICESYAPECDSDIIDPKTQPCAIDPQGRYYVQLCSHWLELVESKQIATFVHEAVHHAGPRDVLGYSKSALTSASQAGQLNSAANYENFAQDVALAAWGCEDNDDQISRLGWQCNGAQGTQSCLSYGIVIGCKDVKHYYCDADTSVGTAVKDACPASCEHCKNKCSIPWKDKCKNGGTPIWVESKNSCGCDCKWGYSGDTCDLQACVDIGNSSSCSSFSQGDCATEAGQTQCPFTCKNCTGYCTLPCVNGGTPIWLQESGSCACSCMEGYSGDLCETFVATNPSVNCSEVMTGAKACSNGGTPTWAEETGLCGCSCIGGYIGEKCETLNATQPTEKACSEVLTGAKECKNGMATKANETNLCVCSCNEGYSGETCETLAPPQPVGGACSAKKSEGICDAPCIWQKKKDRCIPCERIKKKRLCRKYKKAGCQWRKKQKKCKTKKLPDAS